METKQEWYGYDETELFYVLRHSFGITKEQFREAFAAFVETEIRMVHEENDDNLGTKITNVDVDSQFSASIEVCVTVTEEEKAQKK